MTYHRAICDVFGHDKVFIEFDMSSETFMRRVGLESLDGDAAVVSRSPGQESVGIWRSRPLVRIFPLETCSTQLPSSIAP